MNRTEPTCLTIICVPTHTFALPLQLIMDLKLSLLPIRQHSRHLSHYHLINVNTLWPLSIPPKDASFHRITIPRGHHIFRERVAQRLISPVQQTVCSESRGCIERTRLIFVVHWEQPGTWEVTKVWELLRALICKAFHAADLDGRDILHTLGKLFELVVHVLRILVKAGIHMQDDVLLRVQDFLHEGITHHLSHWPVEEVWSRYWLGLHLIRKQIPGHVSIYKALNTIYIQIFTWLWDCTVSVFHDKILQYSKSISVVLTPQMIHEVSCTFNVSVYK
mmetsp:Transcript_33816/g.40877  ORF Transcript_33816/g.40877 Transcript_33816/m.40877 type:complete len:277 (+) Transcript_33816:769-1599(+)